MCIRIHIYSVNMVLDDTRCTRDYKQEINVGT